MSDDWFKAQDTTWYEPSEKPVLQKLLSGTITGAQAADQILSAPSSRDGESIEDRISRLYDFVLATASDLLDSHPKLIELKHALDKQVEEHGARGDSLFPSRWRDKHDGKPINRCLEQI